MTKPKASSEMFFSKHTHAHKTVTDESLHYRGEADPSWPWSKRCGFGDAALDAARHPKPVRPVNHSVLSLLFCACACARASAMTRFIQYPFDKTKMAEVREWAKGVGLKDLRAVKGVKNVELSFCPGEGWLAARYILCADAPRTLSRTLAHARSHARTRALARSRTL